MPRDFDCTAIIVDGGHDQLLTMEAGPDPSVDQRVRHRIPHPSTEIVDSQFTRRVVPNTAVNGDFGSGCSRCNSSASRSTGRRRVELWTRVLTSVQNCRQADSSSPKE